MANRTQDAVSGMTRGAALPVGDGLRLADAPLLGQLLVVGTGVLVGNAVRAALRVLRPVAVAVADELSVACPVWDCVAVPLSVAMLVPVAL
jgi:hypothetical protein